MKNFLRISLIMVLSFFNIVNANSNIVYVDIDRVLTISKPGSYILKQLGDMKAANVKDFDKKEKNLKENEKKIIKQKNILSPEDLALKVNILKKEIKEYNEYRERTIKNFQKLKKVNTSKLLGLINPILAQYTKDKSISMILKKKDIIIGKAELDITKPIIDLVNKNVKEFKIK